MKTKKKLYWDPSGEEIYKSKLDSANRQVRKDIREYQKYPFEFWVDLGKIILKFFIQFFLFGILAWYPFWLSFSQMSFIIDSNGNIIWNNKIFETIIMVIFPFLIGIISPFL